METPPKKVGEKEILANFEMLSQRLNTTTSKSNSDEKRTEINSKAALLKSLQSYAFEFLEISKKVRENLTPNEIKTLDRLSSDKSIPEKKFPSKFLSHSMSKNWTRRKI